MRFVVDASLVAKTLIIETDSDLATNIVAAGVGAPDLLFPEVVNVLWKASRRRAIGSADLALAPTLLARMNMEIIEGRLLSDRALGLAVALDHPAYDCFYLALAVREAVALVTADARLQWKISASSLPIQVLSLTEAASRL